MQSDIDVPSSWYENFFTGPVNAFWEAMVPAEATKADLDFLARHLGAAPPARILDMPCGAGRHALGLARLGYRVTGVDFSNDAVARASAAAEGLPVRFVRADMRAFVADAPFDAAICLGNSTGYFDADGSAAFFARLAACIRSGGRLVLDSGSCAESLFPLREHREIAFDGGTYRSRFAYDAMRSLLKTEARLSLNGDEHELRYAHHVVTTGALVRALAEAGFRTEALYGDTRGAPFAPGSPRLLLVAARAG
jgi:cyclopropane fatty-acyl-phospholipid synthase-like methyltransferase